jgi:transaldolase/glucose-6-phosphate isomerase
MRRQLDTIGRFSRETAKEGYRHAVLLGMGGSSLAPEVFQATFGHRPKCPELIVLDSTHPGAVRSVEDRIDPARTLFIVSSKSGTTTETLSFYKYFWHRVTEAVPEPGRHFIAITDPGTPLEELAGERGFRRVFLAPPDVGGRYSALSVFGLVPAALIGVDIHRVLDGAWAMHESTGAEASVAAFALGAAIGELAREGRDKLTITTSPTLSAFPAWIEQLVAESTGKDGKGIVPVVGEPLGRPNVYGADRFFVHLSTREDDGKAHRGWRRQTRDGELLVKLEEAGHPVARIGLQDRTLLGQEFFRWEVAVAAAGSVLEIHPFNQPDVQLAKQLAKEAMARRGATSESGWDDGIETFAVDDEALRHRLQAVLDSASPGDYVGIQAYLTPSPRTGAALGACRLAIRDRHRLATTLGFGPRFLHSTGQLHKGGANNGIFVQIVDHLGEPLPVPETDYTFGALIRAQAMGDARALRQRGRRVLRVRLEGTRPDALERLTQILRE